uniref:Uncharacterized protein n=1 Tax=Solanum lycopersicum TaxID=4081 RepID=A0A3Q7I733_SOLLC
MNQTVKTSLSIYKKPRNGRSESMKNGLQQKHLFISSFAGDFGVKATEADSKCLKCRDRILIVHEATVTRPLKLRHQHWSCSCHLGALFFKVRTSSFGLGKGPDEKLSTRVDFDLKKWREGKESTFTGTNSVCVGAKPPGSIEEAGIAKRQIKAHKRNYLLPSPQDIQLIRDVSYRIVASGYSWRDLFHPNKPSRATFTDFSSCIRWLCIIDSELGPQEVGSVTKFSKEKAVSKMTINKKELTVIVSNCKSQVVKAAGREEEIIQCDLQADKDCSSLRTLTGKREIATTLIITWEEKGNEKKKSKKDPRVNQWTSTKKNMGMEGRSKGTRDLLQNPKCFNNLFHDFPPTPANTSARHNIFPWTPIRVRLLNPHQHISQ